MPKKLKRLLQAYVDAWNRQDIKALVSLFAKEAVYVDVALNTTFTADTLADYLRTLFANSADMKYELFDTPAYNSHGVALQYYMRGHDHTGQRVDIAGAEFVQFRGDKIVRVQDYYDWKLMLNTEKVVPPHSRKSTTLQKYRKSGLDVAQAQHYKETIEQLMQQQKRYRDSKLTLPLLASEVGVSANHISQVINSQFGTNFFEFINHYRLTEAQQLLREKEPQKGLILAIALSVGFSSSSAFYVAFKKQCRVTPSQYRRTHYGH